MEISLKLNKFYDKKHINWSSDYLFDNTYGYMCL